MSKRYIEEPDPLLWASQCNICYNIDISNIPINKIYFD